MNKIKGDRKRYRRKYACVVYVLTIIWLFLALAQWLVVCLVEPVKEIFNKDEWICILLCTLATVFSLIFIFFEKLRLVPCLNWLITFLIVEFATFGLFALVVETLWQDLVMWFVICILVVSLGILLALCIPYDVTQDKAKLFLITVVFLIMSAFLIMLFLMTRTIICFLLGLMCISFAVLLFVMYHAQTINGGRFTEMRLNDYLMGTLSLFYDFTIIFLLTFFVMINYKIG